MKALSDVNLLYWLTKSSIFNSIILIILLIRPKDILLFQSKDVEISQGLILFIKQKSLF